MSLVFAGVTPHPPMLIPTVGKEKLEQLTQTKEAMEHLERELYAQRPQLILIISPHTSLFPDSFTVNGHTHFTSAYDHFGDLTTSKAWTGSPDVAARITHLAKLQHIPVQAVSEEKLDHGASVPLAYMTEHLPDAKVLPIGFSGLDPDAHIRFGTLLKEVIMASDKRIAVIASGDLSHCLAEDAPSGFNKQGARFDTTLCAAMESCDYDAIVTMDQSMVADADECGYRSILVMLGIVKNMHYQFIKHSYEHPFGVGYLVGQCVF